MQHADHRALGHAVHLVQEGLHLGRVHVVAAADHQVLAATHELDVAVLVEAAHVAGLEPAVVGEVVARLVGHAPVAAEHVGPAHLDVADHAARRELPLVVAHPQTDARQGKAHRAAPALAVLRAARVRGEHQRLAHAVALDDGVAGALAEGVEGLDEQRRRAADEDPHVPAGLAVERRLGKQPHVHGRHAHEHRGLGQALHDGARCELREPQHRAAVEQRAVRGDEEPVHVEDRQRMDEHVAALPVPVVLQRQRVRQQVAVRQHRALAAAGGSAGVHDGGQVVAAAHGRHVLVGVDGGALEQAAGAIVVQREDMRRACQERGPAQPAEAARGAHHHGRLGVAQEEADLGILVGRIERQVHEAGTQHRQVQQQRLHRLVAMRRDARAGRQIEPGKQVRDARGSAVDVAPRVVQRRAVGRLDRDAVQVGGKGGAQGRVEVLVDGHAGMIRCAARCQPRWKRGGRFSMNAVTPSRWSALSA